MTYPAYLREKARDLRRRQKLTIDELADHLALSRTTIYYWVKDIPIPVTGAEKLAQRRAAQANKRRAKQLRDVAYDEGAFWFESLDRQETFRDFVCMYIGEGYKRCRNRVSIGNSDPAVMTLAVDWLRRMVGDERIHFSLLYHADQDLRQVCAFWENHLDLSPGRIRVLRKSNSNQLAKRTWRSRYGVLSTTAYDTMLRSELEAWMDCVKAEWA
jgi:transcriptional regulator with XRE-family HTH domain